MRRTSNETKSKMATIRRNESKKSTSKTNSDAIFEAIGIAIKEGSPRRKLGFYLRSSILFSHILSKIKYVPPSPTLCELQGMREFMNTKRNFFCDFLSVIRLIMSVS